MKVVFGAVLIAILGLTMARYIWRIPGIAAVPKTWSSAKLERRCNAIWTCRPDEAWPMSDVEGAISTV
jgi:hypothetical protein